jgi:flagellin-like hook-associated protein FlgL
MSISGVNTTTAIMVQQLVNLRSQLDDLQRQLSTGQKVDTYSGISSQAQLVVGLNSRLAAISSFQDTNNTLNARLAIAQTTLTQFDTVTTGVRNGAQQSTYKPSANGQTVDQTYAYSQLDELLSLLNTQSDGRYMFSGAAVNQQSVALTDTILNGSGSQAGLKQIIAERNQADLGLNGLGRLVIPPSDAARVTGTLAAIPPATVSGTVNIAPPFTSAGGTLVINGKTVTIPAKSDATAILNAINTAGAGVTATLNGGNQLVLTNTDATKSLDIAASNPPVGNVLGEVGLTAASTPPPNLIPGVVPAAGQTLTIQVGPIPANTLTITFGPAANQVQNLAQLANALQSLTGGVATVDASGNISVAALNTSDTITIGGTAPLASFGLAAGVTNPPAAGTGTQVSLSEDAINSEFGFKLDSTTSNLTGVSVSQPSGSPKGIAINVTGTPNAGETLTVNVKLPDGTTDQVTLTATTDVPPPPNQFTIGATPGATAANIQAALTASVHTLAATQLTAASAIQASRNFFDVDAGQPPQRVAGPPFATATALRNGTSADTVSWYMGDMGSNPRRSATARIDSAATVAYGMQANEQALRTVIENVAVFAATVFPIGNSNSNAAYVAFSRRVGVNLNAQAGDGTQKTSDIETDLANAQNAIQTTTSQQKQTQVTLQNFIQGITGVSNEQVASEILTLQTQLQASLQTTAMLSKLTLTNYIS